MEGIRRFSTREKELPAKSGRMRCTVRKSLTLSQSMLSSLLFLYKATFSAKAAIRRDRVVLRRAGEGGGVEFLECNLKFACVDEKRKIRLSNRWYLKAPFMLDSQGSGQGRRTDALTEHGRSFGN